MSLLAEAQDNLVELLAQHDVAGIIIDPRNIQPPCILIDPPTIVGISADLVTLQHPVICLAPPPGNRDAIVRLLEDADAVMNAVPVTTGQYGTTTIGSAEMPSYRLTVQLTYRRDIA